MTTTSLTKEQIIKELEKRIKSNQRFADKFGKNPDDHWLWNKYLGMVEAYKYALLLVEAMHDGEYWNETIANAIAMGDRG